jgi:putative chitinase
VTPQQLAAAAICSAEVAEKWAQPLTDAMARFAINTTARMAPFIAQVAYESGRLSVVEENLHYRAPQLLVVFPGHFTDQEARAYAMKPERIASRAYANRNGNGDEASGDGWRFRGRGLLQITGRENYADCGEALGVDLLTDPDRLLEPPLAAMSAGWFWAAHGLNVLADSGNFARITIRINGALNGQSERLIFLASAKTALEGKAS